MGWAVIRTGEAAGDEDEELLDLEDEEPEPSFDLELDDE